MAVLSGLSMVTVGTSCMRPQLGLLPLSFSQTSASYQRRLRSAAMLQVLVSHRSPAVGPGNIPAQQSWPAATTTHAAALSQTRTAEEGLIAAAAAAAAAAVAVAVAAAPAAASSGSRLAAAATTTNVGVNAAALPFLHCQRRTSNGSSSSSRSGSGSCAGSRKQPQLTNSSCHNDQRPFVALPKKD